MDFKKSRLAAITEPDDAERLAKAESYVRVVEFAHGWIGGTPTAGFVDAYRRGRATLAKGRDTRSERYLIGQLEEMTALAKALVGQRLAVVGGQEGEVVEVGTQKEGGLSVPTVTLAVGQTRVVVPVLSLLA